jgi:hypothetical protein
MTQTLRIVLALVLLLTFAMPAHAQLDPGFHDIRQGGHVVGQIYVPARAAGATSYLEHWVLFSAYVYPSGGRDAVPTEIVASGSSYASERDFFARVPFAAGSRYVRVQSVESAALPSP